MSRRVVGQATGIYLTGIASDQPVLRLELEPRLRAPLRKEVAWDIEKVDGVTQVDVRNHGRHVVVQFDSTEVSCRSDKDMIELCKEVCRAAGIELVGNPVPARQRAR